MGFELKGREIAKIGVVGSGQIGPDIALSFLSALGGFGVTVIVVDVSEDALAKGRAKVEKKIAKLVEKGRLKKDKADAQLERIAFTSDYAALEFADLVVEAATEDLGIKRKIFAQLEATCADSTILTSNSSHLEPEVIFAEMKHPERAAVTHYFFPAERNPLVEVVSGAKTDAALARFLLAFYEQLGKLPVAVGSRYGYAVDPVFEGLFLAAALAVERGMATHQQVDAVCQKVLGQGVGPFTAMNLTGGNPLTNVGLAHYHDKIMPWYRSPDSLKAQLDKNAPWPTAGRGETVEVDAETETKIGRWMLGAYIALACEVLDAGLIDVSDFDAALSLGLAMKSPFTMMNRADKRLMALAGGEEQSEPRGLRAGMALVKAFAEQNEGVKVSTRLAEQIKKVEPWPLRSVLRHDEDGVAVLTIRRFRVLNALDGSVLSELSEHVDDIAHDDSVKAVVLRGFGTRAFVSGADINELAALETAEAAVEMARRGQAVLRELETLDKPVIAAMNGLAFGGGNELAMSCHARLAAAGQRVFVGQPEPKLGIIPGYGGTQRLVRLCGIEAAWPMLRDGNPISSARAKEIGLVRDEVPAQELLDAAIALARKAADGSVKLQPIEEGPIALPDTLPDVDLAHLSRAIDEIICDVIKEGAASTLEEGLDIEARGFARCLACEDFRIGMKNFIENGPKSAATFVHR
ncbi:MAG: enoyl-CoA hydratase/isomerase family protein [Myxococcales bacterium]|nr:enoyl-CoA hydratase/isomerase family protein [Myxococcales bacterium]